MKKLAALVLLAALAAGVWYAARWFRHRGDLTATIIMRSAGRLEPGDHVTESGVVIGEVTKIAPIEQKDAVSVRVDREHTDRVLTDSLFRVEGEDPPRLEVTNTIAVGKPIENGAVVYAREDKLSRWLADKGASFAPLIKDLTGKAERWLAEQDPDRFERELESLRERVPQWKAEGKESLDRNVEALQEHGRKLEQKLRALGREADADRLKAKVDELVQKAKE